MGVASGSGWNQWVWLAGGGCGWNLWVCLVGVVVRRYIYFLILLIPTPLVSALFCSSIPTFLLMIYKEKDFVYFQLLYHMLENVDDDYIWQNSMKCTTFTIEIFLLVRMQFNYLYTIVPEGILPLK